MNLIIISLLFFTAILFALVTTYMGFAAVRSSPSYELRRRLRRLAVDMDNRRFPTTLRTDILGEMSRVERVLYRSGLIRKIDLMIDSAGLKIDIRAFLLLMLATASAGFMVGYALGRPPLGILLMVLGLLLPITVLSSMKHRRMNRFTEQFPDALDMLARSLRAGHSLTAAMKMVGDELADPIAGVYRTVYEETSLGLPLREALSHMTMRMPSLDTSFFVAAITINTEVGGNLSEILDRLAETIRERLKIRRQVRVYSAQARLSGYILAALPIFMAAFFFIALPGYMEEIWEIEFGKLIIAGAATAQLLGFLIIRKIINIRI